MRQQVYHEDSKVTHAKPGKQSATSTAWLVAGILAGILGGAAFASAENLYVLATAEIVPAILSGMALGAAMLFGGALGVLAGAAAALTGGDPTRRWQWLVGVWAFGSTLAALLLLPELDILDPSGRLAVGLGGGLAGAWIASREPQRGWKSPLGPLRLMLVGLSLSCLTILGDLQSRILPDLLSLRSLATYAGVLASGALLILMLDRLTSRLAGHRSSIGQGLMACMVPIGLSLALPLVHEVPGASPAPIEKAAERSGPDVILIVLDTTRADVLSPFGAASELSPALATLAEESVVYRRAIAPSSWTLPSHGTLLTGLYPRQHGADLVITSGGGTQRPELAEAAPLRQDVETLATWFSRAGYRTGAVLANAGYLHPDFGLSRGFDFYDARFGISRRRPSLTLPLQEWLAPEMAARQRRWCRTAPEILDESLDWLQAQEDAPVFLLVNLMDAHDPYTPSPKFESREGRIPGIPNPYPALARGERAMTSRDRTHLRASYEASIQTQDHALGRFFDALRRTGRLEDSLVVVVSDHGELLGERDMVGHGREVLEPLVHVPLIVRHPGGRVRGEVWSPVHLVDVAPSLLRLSGLAVPSLPGRQLPLPGEPLERATEDPFMSDERPLLVEVRALPVEGSPERTADTFACLYEDAWKFCETTLEGPRLFDLARDPGEEQNLAPAQAEAVVRLGAALDAARQRVHPLDQMHPAETISPAARERLRALGYVQ